MDVRDDPIQSEQCEYKLCRFAVGDEPSYPWRESPWIGDLNNVDSFDIPMH